MIYGLSSRVRSPLWRYPRPSLEEQCDILSLETAEQDSARDVRFQLYVETINIWGADGFLGWASNRGPQKFQQRLQVTCVLFFITVLLKNTKDAKSSRCVYSRLLPLEKHIFLILVSMRTCCMKDWTSTSQNDQALGEQAQTDIHRNTAKNHGVFTLLAQLP